MIRRPSTGMFCFVEILEKELVMKIKVGDKIDEIELPDTNGNMFKLSSTKGKKVLLTFYRIAGCSFCNLRLMEFKKKSDEFGRDFVHVGIFHSPTDNLNRTMRKHGNLPFKILADEHFKYFEKYEVERSMGKVFLAMLFKAHKIFPAIFKGFIPMRIKGFFDIAITDVFINEKGIVSDVLYAKKDSADHFPFEKVRAFSKGI